MHVSTCNNLSMKKNQPPYPDSLSLSLISPSDTRMHPVLKGLGITDKAISFIMDSSNDNKVKSSCDQGSLAKAPMPSQPLPVDAAKERQPGVRGRGLRLLIVSDRPWSAVLFFGLESQSGRLSCTR